MSQKAAIILRNHAGDKPLESAAAAKILSDYLKPGGVFSQEVFAALAGKVEEIETSLGNRKSLKELPENQRTALRTAIYFTCARCPRVS